MPFLYTVFFQWNIENLTTIPWLFLTDYTGRIPHATSKISGHSRPVLDIKWDPFNDNIIASASEDCKVKLWHIPDGGLGLASDLTEHLVELQGHRQGILREQCHISKLYQPR